MNRVIFVALRLRRFRLAGLYRLLRFWVLVLFGVLVVGLAAASRSPAAAGATASVARIDLLDFDSIDPAVAYTSYSWQLEYATCAKLLNYADAPGTEGVLLRPEIAARLPSVSADGRVYTFRLRNEFRFPDGGWVTAFSMKQTFERAIAVGPGSFFLRDVDSIEVVGDSADQLRFTLAGPAGDFLARVAMPFFCAVPPDTPFVASSAPIPSAGPYFIDSYTPASSTEGEIVLKRNPSYLGWRKAHFDEIRYQIGVDPWESLERILAGEIDYAPLLPASAYPQLASEFPDRFFVNPVLGFRYLILNTSRPLFADVHIRQAVNYAIDRPALASVFSPFAVTPTDHYLPSAMPGYRDVHVYPLDGPDIKTARTLADGLPLGTPALMYTTDRPLEIRVANIVAMNLAQIGIQVEVRVFSTTLDLLQRLRNGEGFDIAFIGGSIADYADPFPLINLLLDGAYAGDTNLSYFDDPVFNQRLEAAALLSGAARYDTYGQLDLDLMDAAPLAAFGTINSRDFFSARIGCQVFQPVYGISLVSLCLKKT